MGTIIKEVFYFYLVFWEVQKDNSSLRRLSPKIQNFFGKYSIFFKRVVSISRYSTFNCSFASICTREEPRTGNPMGFTPQVEDKVFRDSVSHKLDIPLVNP